MLGSYRWTCGGPRVGYQSGQRFVRSRIHVTAPLVNWFGWRACRILVVGFALALHLANVLLGLQVLGKPQQFACIATPQRRAARARCVLYRLCCALRLKRCAILRHSSSIYFALEAHGFCFSVVATRATCTTASALIATAGALQSGGAPRFIVCVSMQAFAHVDKDTYRTLGNRAR